MPMSSHFWLLTPISSHNPLPSRYIFSALSNTGKHRDSKKHGHEHTKFLCNLLGWNKFIYSQKWEGQKKNISTAVLYFMIKHSRTQAKRMLLLIKNQDKYELSKNWATYNYFNRSIKEAHLEVQLGHKEIWGCCPLGEHCLPELPFFLSFF